MGVSVTNPPNLRVRVHDLTHSPDFSPKSNSGRAFYVFWSLLAVPSLTILISNMGDTIVKWVSDLTNWVGRLTVLPGESGLRATIWKESQSFAEGVQDLFKNFTGPGVFGFASTEHAKRISTSEYEKKTSDRLAKRLIHYVDKHELNQHPGNDRQDDVLEKDIQFYHYVLARECRNLQKDLNASPPKQFTWPEWEYFLKLMGDEDDVEDYPCQRHPDIMVPEQFRAPDGLASPTSMKDRETYHGSVVDGTNDDRTEDDNEVSSSDELHGATSVDGNIDRRTSALEDLEARRKQYRKGRPKKPDAEPSYLHNWSWLSNESPLMSNRSEAAWILERLSAALERELNRQRKGYKKKPPIALSDVRRAKSRAGNGEEKGIDEDVVQP